MDNGRRGARSGRFSGWDGVGIGLAVGVGLPSLAFPPHRDLATFLYGGALFAEGALPYAHAVDSKGPGIFLQHALLAWVAGPLNTPASYALELALVLMVGWLSALIARGEERPRPGEIGLACLLASSLHYSVFDFATLGTVELPMALCLLGGLRVLRRPSPRAAAVAGALLAVAVVYKVTAALPALVVLGAALLDGEGTRSARLAGLTLGGLGALGALLAPWALAGEWEALQESTLGIYAWYSQLPMLGGIGAGPFHLGPAGAFCALLGVLLVREGASWRLRPPPPGDPVPLLLTMVVLGAASVMLQGKYFLYHWQAETPALTALLWALAIRQPGGHLLRALVIAGLACLSWARAPADLPTWSHNGRRALELLQRARGELPELSWKAGFVSYHDWSLSDNDAVAAHLRAHQAPGDTLQVSGFEPTIYVLSGLYSPSRFFNEHVFGLAPPEIGAAWKREHQLRLSEHPPRWCVLLVGEVGRGRGLLDVGYSLVMRAGRYELYERAPQEVK